MVVEGASTRHAGFWIGRAVMRRTTARGLVGIERFPVDAGVAELSEKWAARALEALRVAVVSRNRVGTGGERGAGSGGWSARRCPRLEL